MLPIFKNVVLCNCCTCKYHHLYSLPRLQLYITAIRWWSNMHNNTRQAVAKTLGEFMYPYERMFPRNSRLSCFRIMVHPHPCWQHAVLVWLPCRRCISHRVGRTLCTWSWGRTPLASVRDGYTSEWSWQCRWRGYWQSRILDKCWAEVAHYAVCQRWTWESSGRGVRPFSWCSSLTVRSWFSPGSVASRSLSIINNESQ